MAAEADEERVVLVDERDHARGTAGKMEAHRTGELHRAFSVFLRDSRGRFLLQRRARGKYHSGGLWSNTCCSHPRPCESVEAAARRRLREELGIEAAPRPAFGFVYRAELDGGLVEHEYDHVLLGTTDARPRPDPDEVEDWRWMAPDRLRRALRRRPDLFTYWLRAAFDELEARGLL